MLNRAVPPAPIRPLFEHKTVKRTAFGVGAILTVGWASLMLILSYDFYSDRTREEQIASSAPLYGIWEVEDFLIDGSECVPDTTRWRRLIFDQPETLLIQRAADSSRNGSSHRYKLDNDKGAISVSRGQDLEGILSYRFEGRERLILEGSFEGRSIQATLRRFDEREFLLSKGGLQVLREWPQ